MAGSGGEPAGGGLSGLRGRFHELSQPQYWVDSPHTGEHDGRRAGCNDVHQQARAIIERTGAVDDDLFVQRQNQALDADAGRAYTCDSVEQ